MPLLGEGGAGGTVCLLRGHKNIFKIFYYPIMPQMLVLKVEKKSGGAGKLVNFKTDEKKMV